MALSVATGNWSTPGATGNQSVTGVGFQPKLVLIFSMRDSGASGAARVSFGAAASSTQRFAHSTTVADDAAAEDTGRTFTTAQCIHLVSNDGATINGAADFVSMDSDGFTVNWSTVPAVANTMRYLALGGTDISNVFVGAFNQNGSTGNQAVTGVGFQPNLLLFGNGRNDTTEGATTNGNFALGAAMSSSSRWANSINITDAADPTASGRGQLTTRCSLRVNNVGAVVTEADFVSMDSDGFTINVVTASGTPRFGYVALAGTYQAAIGSFSQPASTGNQAVTGVGFQPLFEYFCGDMNPTGTTVDHARVFQGVALSSTNRQAVGFTSTDNVGTSECGGVESTTRCILGLSGDVTTNADADFVSQDSDGFTVNWTTADATARQVLFLAMASAAGGTTHTRTASDTLTLADSPQRLANAFRTASETLMLADSHQRLANAFRTVSDTLTFSDSQIRLANAFRSILDVLSLADSTARLANAFRTLTDTLTLGDVVTSALGQVFARQLTETLALADSISRSVSFARSFIDTMTLADSVARLANAFRSLAETVSLSDTVQRLSNAMRATTDTLTLADSHQRIANALRTLSETLKLSDSVLAQIAAASLVAGPYYIAVGEVFVPGAAAGQVFVPGAQEGDVT